MRAGLSLTLLAAFAAHPAVAQQRATVDAAPPHAVSVTVYRDPERSIYDEMEHDDPRGFAVISETRRVTLPPGESRIRFVGVSEGMVAITAIVSGLPGGTIEQNRDAQLLSPAALVDGTLGNRVTITRTNPATGAEQSESAIVRTRADGGLVLQTSDGFEAVRCSGLPEKMSFERIPQGLFSEPVFSINTRDPAGGTYEVRLTYLSWGFDWQANYVGTLDDPMARRRVQDGGVTMNLLSWLTLVNDNGQSFPDASLQVVAGQLNVESDYEDLADAPEGEPLRLRCFPLGSTAEGGTVPSYGSYPPPPPPPMVRGYAGDDLIVVTASRRRQSFQDVPLAITAIEEQLGDLKLYRVPEPVTVAAKSSKQVAFLNAPVKSRLLYRVDCNYEDELEDDPDEYDFEESTVLLAFENKKKAGLGRALPSGVLRVFEPSDYGELMVAEASLRDYASGQDVELGLVDSSTVFAHCGYLGDDWPEKRGSKFTRVRAIVTNANREPAIVWLNLGWASEWEIRDMPDAEMKDGARIMEVAVPGQSREVFTWRVRPVERDED